jgi:NAD(P)-dependent dehydrogenase (short-subunit alcohol dehydrogenase family)
MEKKAMAKKVVMITGAGSGIGRAAAIAFLNAGANVVLVGRRADALAQTLASSGHHGQGLVAAADVTDESHVKAAFDAAIDRFGRIDLLFNNAGAFPAPAAFDEIDAQDWSRILNVNLTGSFLCAREAFRRMKAQAPQGGRIINNGSVSAQSPRPLAAAYTASKHAMTGLTKAISLEGRASNIACGQIDIGNAVTDMFAGTVGHAMQADGRVMIEPSMPVSAVIDALLYMAALPLQANTQWLTVMATAMPLIGRG